MMMNSLRKTFTSLKPSNLSKMFATNSKKPYKVTILGANGGIGQPTALLMKQSPYISSLALYDITNVAGVAADISHIETRAKVTAHSTPSELSAALNNSHVVLIPAGVPRKPGMTRDDLFSTNASIVASLTLACAKYCPEAIICVITNPVNSTVPIAAEMMKREGVYNPKRLLGVSTLDVVRSNTFIAEAKGLDVRETHCPVVGGHSGDTIIPLISQCAPRVSFPEDERKALTLRIQNAGTEVVNAKAGSGSATLSMAYSAARFANSVLQGLNGVSQVIECAFVQSEMQNECSFFASPVLFGKNGIEEIMSLGSLNEFEIQLLKKALPLLKKEIEKGQAFAATYQP